MPVATIRTWEDDAGRHGQRLFIWCPGCAAATTFGLHAVELEPPNEPRWLWDGNLEAPTIRPSILVHEPQSGAGPRCHTFVTTGRWQYLGDSTHAMAGQIVPLPELPDWVVS